MRQSQEAGYIDWGKRNFPDIPERDSCCGATPERTDFIRILECITAWSMRSCAASLRHRRTRRPQMRLPGSISRTSRRKCRMAAVHRTAAFSFSSPFYWNPKTVYPPKGYTVFGTAELTKSEPSSCPVRAVSMSLSVMVSAPSLWLKVMISLSS